MQDRPPSSETNEANTTILAVANSLEIIEILRELGGKGSLAEITDRSQLTKSSVHKHLKTLQESGFVIRNEETYRISLRFLDIGGHVRNQHPETRKIKRKVWEIANNTNEVAFFTVEEDGRPVILFREEGSDGVPTRTRVGKRLYMHQTAAGKAMLAEYPVDRIESIIDQHGLPRATKNTITEREQLMGELKRIRERGYATSVGEATEGLHAVAVPVIQPDREVLGACAVAGPVHRMNDPELGEEILKILQSITNELELSITYSP